MKRVGVILLAILDAKETTLIRLKTPCAECDGAKNAERANGNLGGAMFESIGTKGSIFKSLAKKQ